MASYCSKDGGVILKDCADGRRAQPNSIVARAPFRNALDTVQAVVTIDNLESEIIETVADSSEH